MIKPKLWRSLSVKGRAGDGTVSAAASDMAPRLLTTQAFLKNMGDLGGFKKGIQAFAERWIFGRGCPHLTVGMRYLKVRNALQLAVHQSGCTASQRGARLAAAKASELLIVTALS
eukprot:gene8521-4820_t